MSFASKHEKNRKRKQLRIEQARIYALIRKLRSHAHLTLLLLDIPDKHMRREVYELWKPMLHPSMAGYVYEGEVADYHVSEV